MNGKQPSKLDIASTYLLKEKQVQVQLRYVYEAIAGLDRAQATSKGSKKSKKLLSSNKLLRSNQENLDKEEGRVNGGGIAEEEDVELEFDDEELDLETCKKLLEYNEGSLKVEQRDVPCRVNSSNEIIEERNRVVTRTTVFTFTMSMEKATSGLLMHMQSLSLIP